MTKEELRKVKVYAKPEGFGLKNTNGYFHHWVKDTDSVDGLPWEVSYGIIELEDGNMLRVNWQNIQFVDSF